MSALVICQVLCCFNQWGMNILWQFNLLVWVWEFVDEIPCVSTEAKTNKDLFTHRNQNDMSTYAVIAS